jgi:flagellar biosynthesis GTPase FlhF
MDQQAAAMTRRPKSQARRIHGDGDDADEAARLAAWEAQTAAAEMTALSRVHRDVAAFGRRPAAVIDDAVKEMAARAAVAEVQAHHAVWSLSELRFEAARALPPGASPELVRQVADQAVAPGSGTGVLLVTAPEVTDVTPLGTRKDGTSIYRPPNGARYTTTGQVDLEERILRQARKQVPQRVSEGMARRALEGSGLTQEQEGAAVRLLTSASTVAILTAAAGAGKTHTVAAFAAAWTRLTGRRVIGITTAENAARQTRPAAPSGRGSTGPVNRNRTCVRAIRQPSCRCCEDFLHDHQGRTSGTPDLTAQAVNSENGREQPRGEERPG